MLLLLCPSSLASGSLIFNIRQVPFHRVIWVINKKKSPFPLKIKNRMLVLHVIRAEPHESAAPGARNGELGRDEQPEQPAEPREKQHNVVPISHCITAERRQFHLTHELCQAQEELVV